MAWKTQLQSILHQNSSQHRPYSSAFCPVSGPLCTGESHVTLLITGQCCLQYTSFQVCTICSGPSLWIQIKYITITSVIGKHRLFKLWVPANALCASKHMVKVSFCCHCYCCDCCCFCFYFYLAFLLIPEKVLATDKFSFCAAPCSTGWSEVKCHSSLPEK